MIFFNVFCSENKELVHYGIMLPLKSRQKFKFSLNSDLMFHRNQNFSYTLLSDFFVTVSASVSPFLILKTLVTFTKLCAAFLNSMSIIFDKVMINSIAYLLIKMA